MQVTVLFFAALREMVGASEQCLEVRDASNVTDVLRQLTGTYPALGPVLPQVRVAVNESFVHLEQEVNAGDTLALIPPVAGG